VSKNIKSNKKEIEVIIIFKLLIKEKKGA